MADAKQISMKLALDSITMGSNSSFRKSPTKSPVKAARRQLPVLSIDTGGQSEVNDAPDSSHANDQHEQRLSTAKQQTTVTAPSQAQTAGTMLDDDASHKYIQLLNIASATGMLHGKSKLPTGITTPPAAQRSAIGSIAGTVNNGAAPACSSSASSSSIATKMTPVARVPRSRASILDCSPGPSLIPTSPAVEAVAALPDAGRMQHGSRSANSVGFSIVQSSPSKRPDWRTAAKTTEMAASPARRSLGSASTGGAAASRPHYAFGSRIDSAAHEARKPSPMRQSGPSPVRQRNSGATDRSTASPQRVPAGAKAAAAAPVRSASAPRMAAADKVQCRFAQHQASAAAALRSKTPNPARASRASTAGSVGSSPGAGVNRLKSGGGVLSTSVASGTAQSKHIARMRASDAGASRLPGGGNPSPIAARSASPGTRAAAIRTSDGQPSLRHLTRSVPVAVGTTGSRSAVVGSPTKLRPVAPTGQRASGPRTERVSAMAAAAVSNNSKSASVSSAGIPTLQDRYKTGYKHTPAAQAVAEARAAAKCESAMGSNSNSVAVAVPKLPLGSLLKSPATPGLLRTREIEGGSNENMSSAVPGRHVAERGNNSSASPFLGRISAATPADATPTAIHKQHQLQHTPQDQQQRRLLPSHPGASVSGPGTMIPLSPAATPSAAAASRCTAEGFATTLAEERPGGTTAAIGERMSPPLLPRELSGGSVTAEASFLQHGSCEFKRQSASQVPCLSLQGSTASVDGASVAMAAKGLAQLPLHRLDEEGTAGQDASPPKHRRGGQSSPKGAAVVCSQLLKSKACSVCSNSMPATAAEAAATIEVQTPAAAGAANVAAGTSHYAAAHVHATPAVESTSQTLSFSPGMHSSDSKLRSLVPRLDLTPVLAQAEEDQLEEQQQQQQRKIADQQLLQLEYHDQLLLEHNVQQEEQEREMRSQIRPGPQDGKPSSAAKRGSSAGRRPASGSGGGKFSLTAAEPPPQESFYVYEPVVPAEETRTYDELRRALLKCHNGHKLAANLQGLWGCYQDARRNTEAMAFRGHRLLDQVSNEYCAYKRETEQQLTQLQHERDAFKDNLQMALSGMPVGNRDEGLATKDEQVRELQQENQQLRLQMVEMEKALQKAADYHQAQQADQVPVKARAIAESATTSILFQQTVAQQEELMKSQKMLEDMKAALMIACGTLKQTNYMDPQGPVRSALQPDTIQVLDMMINSTQVEASMLDQAATAAHVVQPQVHIEELH